MTKSDLVDIFKEYNAFEGIGCLEREHIILNSKWKIKNLFRPCTGPSQVQGFGNCN